MSLLGPVLRLVMLLVLPERSAQSVICSNLNMNQFDTARWLSPSLALSSHVSRLRFAFIMDLRMAVATARVLTLNQD